MKKLLVLGMMVFTSSSFAHDLLKYEMVNVYDEITPRGRIFHASVIDRVNGRRYPCYADSYSNPGVLEGQCVDNKILNVPELVNSMIATAVMNTFTENMWLIDQNTGNVTFCRDSICVQISLN